MFTHDLMYIMLSTFRYAYTHAYTHFYIRKMIGFKYMCSISIYFFLSLSLDICVCLSQNLSFFIFVIYVDGAVSVLFLYSIVFERIFFEKHQETFICNAFGNRIKYISSCLIYTYLNSAFKLKPCAKCMTTDETDRKTWSTPQPKKRHKSSRIFFVRFIFIHAKRSDKLKHICLVILCKCFVIWANL